MPASKAKIIQLRKPFESVEVLQDIIKGIESNGVTDFFVIARQKATEEERVKFGITEDYLVRKYWFGEESCVFLLGLLNYMRMEVEDWIRASNEDS